MANATARFKTVILLLFKFKYPLIVVAPFCVRGVCVASLFCGVVLGVLPCSDS